MPPPASARKGGLRPHNQLQNRGAFKQVACASRPCGPRLSPAATEKTLSVQPGICPSLAKTGFPGKAGAKALRLQPRPP